MPQPCVVRLETWHGRSILTDSHASTRHQHFCPAIRPFVDSFRAHGFAHFRPAERLRQGRAARAIGHRHHALPQRYRDPRPRQHLEHRRQRDRERRLELRDGHGDGHHNIDVMPARPFRTAPRSPLRRPSDTFSRRRAFSRPRSRPPTVRRRPFWSAPGPRARLRFAFSGSAKSTELKVTIGDANAAALAVSASPSSVGGTWTVSARVEDASGNGLAGSTVTFSSNVGSVSPTTATTDSTGSATTTLNTFERYCGQRDGDGRLGRQDGHGDSCHCWNDDTDDDGSGVDYRQRPSSVRVHANRR